VIDYPPWLAEVVPALLSGSVPKSIADSGFIAYPAHTLDLSIVLPAFMIAGVSLYLRRPAGYELAPVMMFFAVVMDLAQAGASPSTTPSARAGR
jgi:hypothetical protein